MKKVKIITTVKASEDGINLVTFEEGVEYDISDNLAAMLINGYLAEEVIAEKPEEVIAEKPKKLASVKSVKE